MNGQDVQRLEDERVVHCAPRLFGHECDSAPTVERVKELFGSWLVVLVAAGVLDGDVRPTERGTQSIAVDGQFPMVTLFSGSELFLGIVAFGALLAGSDR